MVGSKALSQEDQKPDFYSLCEERAIYIDEQKNLYLFYEDETWGSCRHWQTIYSIREVSDEQHARQLIRERNNDFTAAWAFEEVQRKWDDSRKNRHRFCVYRMQLQRGKVYLLRIYQKNHPSCNRARWVTYFTYYLIECDEEVQVKKLEEIALNR